MNGYFVLELSVVSHATLKRWQVDRTLSHGVIPHQLMQSLLMATFPLHEIEQSSQSS